MKLSMENNRRKKKLISLEDASRIFGYSKDNILYLAKKGEIKILSKGSSRFVDFELLSEYRKNKDKDFKNKVSRDWRKKRTVKGFVHDIIPPIQKDIVDIKKNITEKTKLVERKVSILTKALYLFLRTSKYGLAILILGVALLGGTLIMGFSPKTEVTEIYPARYEGDWQNMKNGSVRNLSDKAGISEFSSNNSTGVVEFEEEGVQVRDAEPVEIDSQEGSTQSMEPTGEPTEEISFFEKTKGLFFVFEARAEDTEEGVQVGDTEPTEDIDSQEGSTQSMEPTEKQSMEPIEPEEEEEEEKFEDFSGIIITVPDVDGNFLSETQDETKEETQTIFTEELSVVYSGFSALSEKGELKKIKVGFSFSSLESENEDDEVIVSWSLDGQDWDSVSEFVLDKAYSNKDNNGYFYADVFDLSDFNNDTILQWEDVENIRIKFSYLTNNNKEDYVPFFLDAVWLETESEKLNEEDEEFDEKEKIEILSSQKDFKMGEEPEFIFKYEKEESGFLVSIGEAIGVVDYWDDINLTAEIIAPDGETFEVPSEEFGNFSEIFTLEKGGEISIKLKEDIKFKPGLYKIILKVEEDGNVQMLEQDFTWGVLAINVNKSIYLPGEEAYLQMGVLRDDGHTICDANLVLSIKYQVLSTETILSTEDGTIQYSGQCSGNNVTDVPDYFAYYTTGEAGVYEMKLTNLDNGYEIIDSFEVREAVPFDVERIGPSRIYPPADYGMVLKIKVNEDFVGFIQEKVPTSFIIIEQELKIKNQESGEFEIYDSQFITEDEGDGVKLLRWHNLDLKQNDELEIKYTFDAPNVSPDLHLLGPLGFYE